MTPTFLGGDLDFDSTARHWWDKMDAAIAERHAHPKGQQVSHPVRASKSKTGNVCKDWHGS